MTNFIIVKSQISFILIVGKTFIKLDINIILNQADEVKVVGLRSST
jgi:hypothetical protein